MGFIIACDFDGTVTSSDTIIAIMQRFAPADSQAILTQILDRTLSVKEGVTSLFNLLDSRERQAIVEFVCKEVSIRPGFQALLDKAQEMNIPFYIISGGMHFFIDPILNGFTGIKDVYANHVDFSGEKMHVEWRYPCDDLCASGECGTCKPSIVRTLGNHQVIAIGDSVTDIRLAEVADILFTTDKLTDYAETEGISHLPFQTFYDIAEQLEEVVR